MVKSTFKESNTKQRFVLSLDIGNTRTHIGLIDLQALRCLARRDVASVERAENIPSLCREIVNSIDNCCVKTICLSSCIGQKGRSVTRILQSVGYTVYAIPASRPAGFPLKIVYEPAASLGTDRVADALAAVKIFPHKDLIIIDAGTAVKIEYVANSTFMGGAIIPGIQLQFAALHSSTDALPLLEECNGSPPIPPGTSTTACIAGGVIYGIAAAINGIVRRYVQSAAPQPVIIGTGGDWPRLKELTAFTSIFLPDLTLIGTALAATAANPLS